MKDETMGIQQFYHYASVLFKGAIEQHNNTKPARVYDHVLVDLNYLLYNVAKSSGAGDSIVIRNVLRTLRTLLMLTPPKKSCFLAMDGPGPRAKLLVQRERRLKAVEKAEGRDMTLRFTPGTEFMHRFKHNLCLWVLTRLQYEDKANTSWVKYFVSGADREGEGEFKVFEHLSHLEAIHNDPTVDLPNSAEPTDTYLVIGLDSDLILSSLLHSDKVRVDVMRQSPNKKNEYEIYNVALIRSIICNALHGEEARIITDFVFLCLLNGCDYLPRLGGFVFLNGWRAYRTFKCAPENKDRYLVSRLDDGSFELDTDFFVRVLKAANTNVSTLDYIVLTLTNGTQKKLVLNPRDYKSMVNTISQGFLKRVEVRYDTVNAPTNKGTRAMSVIVATFPDGKIMKLGSGAGLSNKAAESEAAKSALEISSPMMQLVLQELVPESKALLTNYIELQLSGMAELEERLPGVESMVTKSAASNNKVAAQAINWDSVVYEYLRMLFWTLEYYAGRCHSYTTYFPYVGTLSVPVLIERLSNRPNQRFTLEDLRRVPGPNNVSQSAETEISHEIPLAPLAFYMGVAPPTMIEPKYVHSIFKSKVSEGGEVVRVIVDNFQSTLTIQDNSSQFISRLRETYFSDNVEALNIANSESKQITQRERKLFLQAFLGFNPTLVFFRKSQSAIHRQLFQHHGIFAPWCGAIDKQDDVTTYLASKFQRNLKTNVVCLAEDQPYAVDYIPIESMSFERLTPMQLPLGLV